MEMIAEGLSSSTETEEPESEEHEPLRLLEWTQRHRTLLAPDKKVDFVRHAYLKDIYNCTARNMVIYKAGQMGASEYLVSYAFHAADERGATVLYVFPTDTHVSDFSSARIGPALEVSEYLSSIVTSGAGVVTSRGMRKRGADRVTLKRVRDRFVYLRGAKVNDGRAPQLKAIDADVLIFDEVDEMDSRAPAIARKRLGHSLIAEERMVSTPTYHDRGIHAAWQGSDQREWFVRCEHCGERQPLTIHNVVTEWDDLGRPVNWHGTLEYPDPGLTFTEREVYAWAACRRCGGKLNRLAEGEWVATYPDRSTEGYHLTKLFSPITPLIEIVENLDTVDETERKEAYNQDLGEPYTPRGGRLTDTVLDWCRRDYGMGAVQGERTTMGVDVGSLLNVVIRGPASPETGERPLRFAGAVPEFGDLARLMREYNVRRMVIDALPETRKAREFQAAFGKGRVWLAYYTTQPTGTRKESAIDLDWGEGVMNLDRTRTLDAMFAGFYEPETRLLPANARDIRDYYAQLKAPVRVLETTARGDLVARYVEEGADHYAHAENYEQVAFMAFGNDWEGGPLPQKLVQESRWTHGVPRESRRSLKRPSRFRRRR